MNRLTSGSSKVNNFSATAAVAVIFLAAMFSLPASAVVAAEDPAGLKAQAEALFAQRLDQTKALAAIEAYRRAAAAKPDDIEVYLRLARALVWVGMQRRGEEEIAYYDQAISVAEEAVRRAPNQAGPHYWLGAAYGLKANNISGLKALKLVDPIKQEMDRVLALDPGYEYGGAHRVLGRLYSKLPGLFGGDKTKAEKHLRTALSQAPGFLLSHLYLADLLIEQGRKDEAKEVLGQALRASVAAGLEPETILWKAEAEKMIKKIETGK
ncbi:MAG: TRAP transporter TatT component family protein [Thermodesulfobacteriota bacterium]